MQSVGNRQYIGFIEDNILKFSVIKYKSCTRLKNIDISKIMNQNIVNAKILFYCCTDLDKITLLREGIKTPNLNNIYGMFNTCLNLKK